MFTPTLTWNQPKRLSLTPLGGLIPPFTSQTLGEFSPSRDLGLTVNGKDTPITSWVFDELELVYHLFITVDMNEGDDDIRVIHHTPNPPFRDQAGVALSGFCVYIPVRGR